MRYIYLTILLILTGCSTLRAVHINEDYSGCQFPGPIYGGVITDLHLAHYAVFSNDEAIIQIVAGLYVVIDLPFSAVADTVLLPYTFGRVITKCL